MISMLRQEDKVVYIQSSERNKYDIGLKWNYYTKTENQSESILTTHYDTIYNLVSIVNYSTPTIINRHYTNH